MRSVNVHAHLRPMAVPPRQKQKLYATHAPNEANERTSAPSDGDDNAGESGDNDCVTDANVDGKNCGDGLGSCWPSTLTTHPLTR